METYEPEENKSNKIHYRKVNIFGDEGVGKTSFISYLEDYKNFAIEEDALANSDMKSNDNKHLIVNKIQKVDIKFENILLHLNIYETNLNKYDSIQMNLDTLLIQTELIIVMWTLNDPESLNNAEKLIDIIESEIKNNKFRNVPIFLIQNKTDLKLISSRASVNDEEILKKIEKIKSKYPDIYIKQLSLLEKKEDDYYEVILEINRTINNNDSNINEKIFDIVKYKYPFTDHKELKKNDSNINIALLGSSATGKTSFIYALENKPINNIQPTTVKDGSFHIKSEIYNEKINITIIDTIGQERFRALTSNTFKKADGFLIFFDVTNKETFTDIDYYFDEIQNNKETKAIILLGNKIDDNNNRAISKQKGKEKADKKGIKYFEISCLYGINIVEILNEIALMSYKNYKFKINENINKNNNDIIDNKNDINKNDEIKNQNKKEIDLYDDKKEETNNDCYFKC